MNPTKIKVTSEYKNIRVDVALAALLNVPRATIQKVIKDDGVTYNDVPLKASYKLKGDETLMYTPPRDDISDLVPYDFPLDIVYEDDDLLIVNKPSGLVVHPAFGHKSDTLVNALIAHNLKLSDINGTYRPGIVHRLDKDTSGLIIVCKNNEVHEKVAKLLKNHAIKREYTALVLGHLVEDAGVVKTYLTRSKTNYQKMANSPTTGKLAITHFTVIERFNRYMLMRLNLETGRTHQIRAHLEFLNTPVIGDALYGQNNTKLYNKGQLLHAGHLEFVHPITKKVVSVHAPLPAYFENILIKLRSNL